jgi:hypothetical protein
MGRHTKVSTDYILDNREVGGLRGKDKLMLVMKIQALFKGVMCRKKIKQRYGF